MIAFRYFPVYRKEGSTNQTLRGGYVDLGVYDGKAKPKEEDERYRLTDLMIAAHNNGDTEKEVEYLELILQIEKQKA